MLPESTRWTCDIYVTRGTINVTLLQADWMLKSQKGNRSDKIFPIMVPERFVQLGP